MNIRIVTDSASDLPQPWPEGVSVLPMTVSFGDRQYQDGVDLTHRQFYELLIEGDSLPTTSQIAPGQFEDAFAQAIDQGETVICITLSSKLSGTYQSACIAAAEFPGKVFVVDSLNVTIAEALLVRRAVALVEQGMGAEEIARQLERERGEIRIVALLDTLEYLKRGGRLSASAALVGGLLSIKPVVTVEDGEVKVIGKARGSKNGNNLLMEESQKDGGVDFSRPHSLGYTGLSDELLRKYMEDSRPLWEKYVPSLPVCTIGGTIGTHVGPGAIAVAFFKKG